MITQQPVSLVEATGIGDAGELKEDWHQQRLNLPIFCSTDANADVTYMILAL